MKQLRSYLPTDGPKIVDSAVPNIFYYYFFFYRRTETKMKEEHNLCKIKTKLELSVMVTEYPHNTTQIPKGT